MTDNYPFKHYETEHPGAVLASVAYGSGVATVPAAELTYEIAKTTQEVVLTVPAAMGTIALFSAAIVFGSDAITYFRSRNS
jgi:hypothetical protein